MLSRAFATLLANPDDEVCDDRGVDNQDDDLACRQVSAHLIQFEQGLAAGRDDGEIFGPRLSEQQAGTLRRRRPAYANVPALSALS